MELKLPFKSEIFLLKRKLIRALIVSCKAALIEFNAYYFLWNSCRISEFWCRWLC